MLENLANKSTCEWDGEWRKRKFTLNISNNSQNGVLGYKLVHSFYSMKCVWQMGCWISRYSTSSVRNTATFVIGQKKQYIKKCHANLSAWNDRAITANNKLNCLPYQMTNVVNLSLRRVHNSVRKNQVLLHGFAHTTKQIHLLQA